MFEKTEGEKRMKRVLVITLVLVMAFASSAMAAVTLKGDFTATVEMDSFRVFTKPYTLEPKFGVTIGASNENKTDDVVNWDFSAGVNLTDSVFELGKYKLGLYDDYFDIWIWGNEQELTAKSTQFSLVSAGKKAAAGTMRARLAVPVMDLAKVTVDLTAPASVRAFVDVTALEGYNFSLGYLREWSDEENVANVIAAGADTTIAAGDIDVNLEVGAGVNLAEELGFAVGFGVDADVIEPLNLEASVTHANANWDGDDLTAGETVLGAGATYTEAAFQIAASGSYTIVKDGDNTNEISLGAKYRMSDALGYDDLFKTKDDLWATNTAPAFGAGVKFVDLGFDNVYADVTSPVLEDMIWVKGNAVYKGGKNFEASVLGHIVPFSKLTIKPLVKFALTEEEAEDEEEEATTATTTTINLQANYKIGVSDTTLNFEGEKVFGDTPKSLLKLSVKVPF